MARIFDLMPDLRVVLLQGNDARNGWARLVQRNPSRARRASVVSTFHPGRQALFHPDPKVRSARVAHREQVYRDVAAVLGH